jgi:hypothetical protein
MGLLHHNRMNPHFLSSLLTTHSNWLPLQAGQPHVGPPGPALPQAANI